MTREAHSPLICSTKCDPRMDVVFVFRDSREKGGLSR